MGKRTNVAKWVESRQRWQINVQKDGQRRTFVSCTPGRAGQREANSKADAWLDEGLLQSRAKVSQVYPAWIAELKLATSKSNWANVESRYNNHVKPIIGSKCASAITEQDLQSVINRAYAKSHLAYKSLRNLRADLVAFVKYCRRCKITTLIPESLTLPQSAKRSQKQILQPHDLIRLFNCQNTIWRGKEVPDEYIHAYRLIVLTGMRPGELLGLRWSDVQGGEIHIGRAINAFGEVTQGKNSNAVRTIVLAQLGRMELEAQRDISPSDGPVFDISNEQHLYKRWKVFAAHNGISPVTLYELRHTFVSVVQVLPEGIVKKLVGHSKSMDTWGTYAHAVEGQDDATATLLEQAFNKILYENKKVCT